MNMVHKILKNLSRAFAVAMIVGPFFTGNAAGAISWCASGCNFDTIMSNSSYNNCYAVQNISPSPRCIQCPGTSHQNTPGYIDSYVRSCGSSVSTSLFWDRFRCTEVPRCEDCSSTYRHSRYVDSSVGYRCGNCEDLTDAPSGYNKLRYPVFKDNGNLNYCHECPDSPGANCGDSGFSCETNWVKVSVTYTDTLYNLSKTGYTCECTATNTYVGYGGNTCHACPNNSNVVSCSNSGGFSCTANYYYKTAYKTTNNYSDRGKYNCMRCPNVNNASELDLSYGNLALIENELTWEEPTTPAKRCIAKIVGNKTERIPDTSPALYATYTITNITPDSNCEYFNNTDELPDASDYSNISEWCYYTYKKKYLSTPAGYGAVNNNTQNATVEPCPAGKYSTDDMVTCSNPPSHSSGVNGDNTDFICDTGYYKSGSVCVRCPLDMNEYTNYTNWTIGTTSAAGATEVTSCFISGPSRGDIYEQSTGHTFQYVGSCNWSGSFLPYYTLCIDGQTWNSLMGYQQLYQSCMSALRNFAENTLNVGTQHGQADSWINSCVYSAVTSSGSCSDASPAMTGYNIFQTNDPSVVQALLTTANEACLGALRILTNQPPRSDMGCFVNRQ